ncbi:MAG TPA: CBS domain-containing protein [Gemmatimonadaceae bacterium]|nr:CBS domain-containing protein [Gemmatimonadaceae bacterium]
MRLAELIRADRVASLNEPELSAATRALVERLATSGVIRDPAKLRGRVEEERGEDIVALDGRAFIAHYRTEAVGDLIVSLGISRRGFAREVGDGEAQRAPLVVLLLAPPRMAARYLQVLRALAKLLSREGPAAAIAAATTPEAIVALAPVAEVEITPQLLARDIMTEAPRTTSPGALMRDAASDMARADIGALPVVEADGLLVGMLSDRELMRHLLQLAALGAGASRHPSPPGEGVRRTVRDVMTRQVLCVSPDQPVAEVASLMMNKDVDQVPVVREGRLVGLLTRGDIVRKLTGF